MILDARIAELDNIFEKRVKSLGDIGHSIVEKIKSLSEEERRLMVYMYAIMPNSDIVNYPVETYLDYAAHGAFLWNNNPCSLEMPEEIFLNYVLFHRVNEEEITPCRSFFYDCIKEEVKAKDLSRAILDLNYWCASQVCYQSTDERTASPMAVYRSGFGRCGEESTFAVSVYRSAGIPARQVYAPRWSHCDDNHAWTEVWNNGKWEYLGACEPEEVLNKGWFTNAASRAMLLHSRWFDVIQPEEEITGKDGAVSLCNQTGRYGRTRKLTVCVKDAGGENVPDARVDFEILNYAEMTPAASLYTKEDGLVSITLGIGSIHIHASKDGEYGECIAQPNDEQVTVVLGAKDTCASKEERAFDIIAPLDGPVTKAVLTEEQKHLGEERRKQEALKLQNKFSTFSQKEGIEKNSYGNLQELIDLLGSNHPLASRIIHTLSKKDLRDFCSKTLMEHIEYAAPYEKVYEPEIFDSYVLSPRIHKEPLKAYRKKLRALLSEEQVERFTNDPKAIWGMIEKEITDDGQYGYSQITTDAAACLECGKGSEASRQILFVAICRTLGIPARYQEADQSLEYYQDGTFKKIQAEKQEMGYLQWKTVDKEILSSYGETYTIAKMVNGVYRTLAFTGFQQEVELMPGSYRYITVNRLPSGNLFAFSRCFVIRSGQTTEAELIYRKAKTEDMLVDIQTDAFTLEEEDGRKIDMDQWLQNKNTLVVFLDVGNEPTEHILNELREKEAKLKKADIPLAFVLKKKEDMQDRTLSRTLRSLDNIHIFYNDSGSQLEALARRMYVDPEKLPLVIVFSQGLTGVYACAGYNVGTAEMLLKVFRAVEKE